MDHIPPPAAQSGSPPSWVPERALKGLSNLFSNKATAPTGAPTPKDRSILVQKGLRGDIARVFAKTVLGKDLYNTRVDELRKPYVEALATVMKERAVTAADLEGTSSTEVAKAHLEVFPPKTTAAPALNSDGNQWIALRYDRGPPESVKPGFVNTTSERSLADLDKQDLTNIYVKISDTTGHISITCGVIDTKAKADAFVAALEWAQKERDTQGLPKPPLRISMHQLNSMGVGPGVFVSEKALVASQHEMALYINSRLSPDGSPVVSHTNRCLNGFTQIRGEDAKSHSINQEGLALQMQWVFEDVKGKVSTAAEYSDYKSAQDAVTTTSKRLQQKREVLRLTKENNSKLKEKLDEVNGKKCALLLNEPTGLGIGDPTYAEKYGKLEAEAKALESQISGLKALEKDIYDLEKTLEKQNKTLCIKMKDLCAALPDTPEKAKLQLALRVLSSQTDMNKTLGFPQLSSTQELACMLLLDEALNVTTEINCKSGLDRTGFTRSLQTAVQMKMKKDNDLSKTMNFLLDFETNVKKYDTDRTRLALSTETTREIAEFQQNIMTELQGVALEITKRSTGLSGLKWHWGVKTINPFQKNPHFMNWLPLKGPPPKETPYFTLDKNGNRTPTRAVIELLCGRSAKRGG